MATPEEMRSEVEVPALPRLPWSKEVMALEARDEFYNPIRTVPFLHHLLNNAEANNRCIKGESSFYGVDLEEIFDRLPSDQLKVEARQRSAELRGLIQESAQAAKDLEIEHWRQRFFDLHSAVESGHYVIIDYEPGSDDTVRGGAECCGSGIPASWAHESRFPLHHIDVEAEERSARPRKCNHLRDSFDLPKEPRAARRAAATADGCP